MDAPVVGKLIENGDRRRDAIHVAIAPVMAAETLFPGQPIGFTDDASLLPDGIAAPGPHELLAGVDWPDGPVGVVDPYLHVPVQAGHRFWMFVMPNTVTSLRHVWTHPAFVAKEAVRG